MTAILMMSIQKNESFKNVVSMASHIREWVYYLHVKGHVLCQKIICLPPNPTISNTYQCQPTSLPLPPSSQLPLPQKPLLQSPPPTTTSATTKQQYYHSNRNHHRHYRLFATEGVQCTFKTNALQFQTTSLRTVLWK